MPCQRGALRQLRLEPTLSRHGGRVFVEPSLARISRRLGPVAKINAPNAFANPFDAGDVGQIGYTRKQGADALSVSG